MKWVKTNEVRYNDKNPRVIRDDKFAKLKRSIIEFPEMLEKRPLVCVTREDGKLMVLGGNMRLKVLNDIGAAEVPVILADDWTEEQRARFLIADNVGFGEWDWEQLANEWDNELLAEWGLTAPYFGHDVNTMSENDLDLTEDFDPIGKSSGLQRVVFLFDSPDEAESYLNNLQVTFIKRNMAWQVNLSTRSI